MCSKLNSFSIIIPGYPSRLSSSSAATVHLRNVVDVPVSCLNTLKIIIRIALHLCAILHPMDLLLVHVLLETRVKVLPPVEKEGFANELEPWREKQSAVAEHCPQFFGGDVFGIADLVGTGVEDYRCFGFDEQNVVNCAQVLTSAMHSKLVEASILSCSPHFPSLGAL